MLYGDRPFGTSVSRSESRFNFSVLFSEWLEHECGFYPQRGEFSIYCFSIYLLVCDMFYIGTQSLWNGSLLLCIWFYFFFKIMCKQPWLILILICSTLILYTVFQWDSTLLPEKNILKGCLWHVVIRVTAEKNFKSVRSLMS